MARSTPQNPPPTLDDLILRYRTGDSRAAEDLLLRFEPYCKKWNRLLIFRRWDGMDSEVAHFLYLLGGSDIHRTLQILDIRLQAYEPEDLRQEVIVSFLDAANRYGHIIRYFRYILKERVFRLISDPLVVSCASNTALFEDTIAPKVCDVDESWVAGITCAEIFLNLSRRDRSILRLARWCGYTIKETAERLGVSEATVNRAIRKAKDLVKRGE
jgi:DNA-binding NarL/FixJ family response regulator